MLGLVSSDDETWKKFLGFYAMTSIDGIFIIIIMCKFNSWRKSRYFSYKIEEILWNFILWIALRNMKSFTASFPLKKRKNNFKNS